jgi:iron complex transport system substrate-binding protein
VPRARIAAILALALLAAGCGGGDEREPAADAAPRTITDATGRRVEVPGAPRRVVALSEPTLDGMLALGLRPVAIAGGRGQAGAPNYLAARVRGTPLAGGLGQPNLERIAALRPDLILLDGTSAQDRQVADELERIAPTVYASRNGEDWRAAFTALGGVLGVPDRARKVLAAHDARVADLRGRLGSNAGATVSIVRWSGFGLPAVLLRELAASRVIASLGLRRPPSQDRRGPGHTVPISLERIADLDADWMFVGALGTGTAGAVSDTNADVAAAELAVRDARDTPGFGLLNAVRRGHVVPVDGSAWTSAGGPLAEAVVLDDVERTLAAER